MYISVVTGVVTSSIICTIFISQIHHRGEVAIPYALRRFTFDFLAVILCLRTLRRIHGARANIPKQAHNIHEWTSRLCKSGSATRIKLLNGVRLLHAGNGNPESEPCLSCSDENPCSTHKDSTPPHVKNDILTSIDCHLQEIIAALGEYENRRIETATSEFRVAEWKAVGKVFDRFFFILFIAIMLTITIFFLMPPSDDGGDELSLSHHRPTPTNH